MQTGQRTMRAVRSRTPQGPKGLTLERIDVPDPSPGEALIRVHAAAITRDELDWPADRLPATPSYELSGVVTAVAPDVERVRVGDAVFALTPFDRDGVAAEFAAVPEAVLAPKPHAATTCKLPPCRCHPSPPGRGCSCTAGSSRANV